MSYTKTIVCLANSRKPPSGRCVAGREYRSGQFGDWVRPVSERDTREVSEEERRYQDGTDPRVLDIISIVMKQPVPNDHQQENHLIDPKYYWEKKGRVTFDMLQSAVEAPGGALWGTGSSNHGINDQVPSAQVASLKRSLYLIQPEQLALVVATEDSGQYGKRRRVRAEFNLNQVTYRLSVTDPPVEREYLAKSDGQYSITAALLCVSLGEVFKGYAYKLVAAVITPERA